MGLLVLEKSNFIISLRFDLFYALHTLLSPNSRLHPQWRQATLSTLPARFFELWRSLGEAWEIWSVLPATLPKELAQPTFAQIINHLASQNSEEFTALVIQGLVHYQPAVEAILKRNKSLAAGLSMIPKSKSEWLAYIGLYPFNPTAPLAITLEALLARPESFQSNLVELVRIFWTSAFEATWSRLQPALSRSLAEKERLFFSVSTQEFFQTALIRVEVDQKNQRLKALRGGYSVAIENMARCYFLPSAFNDRRYWSSLGESEPPVVVYFPYFDPALSVDPTPFEPLVQPELDPALIFKALGDSTRYAIAAILARSPTTAVELARQLGVSKPTISHHVNLLREAGLLQETAKGGSVRLALRRSVLEGLSALVVDRLFVDDAALPIRRIEKK